MTDCEKIQEMISAMLDGELSESEEQTVEAHIAECPECAAMYADFAAISAELGETIAEVPATLHSKIMKAVRVSQKPKKSVLIQLRPYLSTAACLAVIVAAVFAMRGGSAKSDSLAAPAAPQAPAAAVTAEAPMEKAENSFAAFSFPETEAADAEEDMAYALGEPAAPAEPADDGLNARLDGLPDYIPGTEIDEAWFISVNSETGYLQTQRILFPEILREVIDFASAEIPAEPLPEIPDALLNLSVGDDYLSLRLYFLGETIVVETSEKIYTAVGTPEEFLSINDYTIS